MLISFFYPFFIYLKCIYFLFIFSFNFQRIFYFLKVYINVNWDKLYLCEIAFRENIWKSKVSNNFLNYFDIDICSISRRLWCIDGREENVQGVSFFIGNVCDYYFFVPFFIRAISDFFYYHNLVLSRGRERGKGEKERGWRKRDKSADKRLRFIASLILFIDMRIALRLRSQATTSAKFSREIRSCKNALRVVYPHNSTVHARTFLPCMSIIHIYQTAHSISCH